MDILDKLKTSKFRSNFHLNSNMKNYVNEKGIDTIKIHTEDFIIKRLKPAYPKNDGKQTPMKQTHPTFIAQHATATCCRGCLEKWHHIPKGQELTPNQINYIINIIIKWINQEMRNQNE